MSDARSEHEKLVEDVNSILVDGFGFHDMAEDIIALILSRLHDVTPEMVEAVARGIAQADEQNGAPPYEYRIQIGKHSRQFLTDQAASAIAAYLAASPLYGGKS